jgi:hypothetical protein
LKGHVIAGWLTLPEGVAAALLPFVPNFHHARLEHAHA